MILPKIFDLHENRLKGETLEAIEFQFERLGLKSSNYKIFLEKFLHFSKSPTLPPDDHEVYYLASKIAYMLANYNYFEDELYIKNKIKNVGAMIWYALAKGAQGDITTAIKILNDAKSSSKKSNDILPYIESLGLLAQLYFIKGSVDNNNLEDIIIEIDQFKNNHENSLPDFEHVFMPAYLIKARLLFLKSPPKDMILEFSHLLEIANKIGDIYWIVHLMLDLAQAYLLLNNVLDSKKSLEETFQMLKDYKFQALNAKGIKIMGEYFERNNQIKEAEMNYLSAKDLYKKLNDNIGFTSCISKLAKLAYNQNDIDKAEKYFTESYNLAQDVNDSYTMAVTLTSLGKIALDRHQYVEALATYLKASSIIEKNGFDYLLPSANDGLSYIYFITGDFWSALETKQKSYELKDRFNYSQSEILIEHMKLGQLYSLVGNIEESFIEFEKALNLCVKLDKKDEFYFDILTWLFELATALGKLTLAETYVNRADLFASIHNSEEEGEQVNIARIRFLLQKREIEQASEKLEVILEKAQEFTSAFTMALALVEKSAILIYQYLEKNEEDMLEAAINSVEDMVFISLDLDFIPLTMYAKRILIRILAFKQRFKDAIEEIEEAVELAEELGMEKYEVILNGDVRTLESLKKIDPTKDESVQKYNDFLFSALDILRETFWLVSSSEYQKV